MNGQVVARLLVISAVAAGCLSAGTVYTLNNATVNNLPLAGSVEFYLSGCNASGANCTLNIQFTNTEASPTSASQELSGVSFTLVNGTTDLTALGTVGSTISNGSGGAVTVVNSDGSTTTTMTTPSRWTNSYSSSTNTYTFTTIGGSSPDYMVVGPGPYGGNGSFTGHAPDLEGTVDFTISGITNLNASTDLSNVSILVGTGPDAIETSVTCSTVGGGSCTTGDINTNTSTPEPLSSLLLGGGLIGLAFLRRQWTRRA